MPQFVILQHETPPGYPRPNHFDLMLERAGALRTWALPAFPAAGQSTIAEQLADHRPAYLAFEGAVSPGRGSVQRVAEGIYETLEERADLLRVRLSGDAIAGELTLSRQAGDAQRWCVSLAST
ncbi:MAG: DNA polymerase ligase N-terminal domain-containing protein [Pirellulaceae bacterium]